MFYQVFLKLPKMAIISYFYSLSYLRKDQVVPNSELRRQKSYILQYSWTVTIQHEHRYLNEQVSQ